ncbi:MAG: relaxase/mobilization nuclease domain-containing protein [Stigonema ocellatum SAG 48.90 = DSM 106950]|nr:relaxase/mobilization nuclease domain-containing protein [Stigonema ocellatum SAG 48.90 = DSM 106950]
MIGKTSIGRSFKGCCAYNMEKVEKGKGEVIMSQGVRDYEQKAMVADFVRQAQLNPDLSRSVWHTAISFDPQDEARLRANPQLMQSVASDYLRGMGLDQSQYAVIQHRDTGHSHFHIIANRVANDGQTVSDSHNFSRSETLLRQIEQKYELTPMNEQAQRKSLENVPERDRERLAMRDQVRESLSRSASSQELRDDLARHHISMIVNRDQAGQPRGISFEQVKADQNGEEIRIAFKGSKLHQNLGMGQLQEQLGVNAQLRQKQALEAEKEKQRVEAQKIQKSPQIEDKSLKRGHGRRM